MKALVLLIFIIVIIFWVVSIASAFGRKRSGARRNACVRNSRGRDVQDDTNEMAARLAQQQWNQEQNRLFMEQVERDMHTFNEDQRRFGETVQSFDHSVQDFQQSWDMQQNSNDSFGSCSGGGFNDSGFGGGFGF